MKKLAIAVIVLMWILVAVLTISFSMYFYDKMGQCAVINLSAPFYLLSTLLTIFIYDKIWRQTGLK